MTPDAKSALAGGCIAVAMMAFAAAFAQCIHGCARPPMTDPRAVAFGFEMQLCVQNASTREAAERCAQGVELRFSDASTALVDASDSSTDADADVSTSSDAGGRDGSD